ASALVVSGHLFGYRPSSRAMIGLQPVSLQPGRRRLAADTGSFTDRSNGVAVGQARSTPVAVVDPCVHDGSHPRMRRPAVADGREQSVAPISPSHEAMTR